jgi:regulator of protease activity HflC (stomatin/prohibitin superfamily)
MTRWYENPVRAYKESRIAKQAAIEATRPGEGPLLNYPTDQFFSPSTFKFLVIPEGYAGVKQHIGRMGKILESRLNPNGLEIDDAGNRIEVIARDIPWGGAVEPGFKFMLGLGGLWSRMAVVKTQRRIQEITSEKVITEKGHLELPKVVSTLTYSVIDPVRAMTVAEDYKRVAKDLSQVRIRDAFAPSTLDEIADLRFKKLNLAPAPTDDLAQQLRDIGLAVRSLYITDFDLPDDAEKALRAKIEARITAEGRLEEAKIGNQIAEADAASAAIYSGDPIALEVLKLRNAVATGGVKYDVGMNKLAEALGFGIKIVAKVWENKNKTP